MPFLTNLYPTPGTLKYVSLFGDSITVGYSNQYITVPNYELWNGGFRLPLLRMATAENKRVTFIGNQLTNSVGMNNRNHDGVSGESIDQIKARIIAFSSVLVPSVVILHAGTNDFYNYQLTGANIALVQNRHLATVDAIFAKWPSCKLIVCTIGNWFNITGTADGTRFAAMQAMTERAGFNTYVAGLPVNHTNGANIRAVSLHSVLNSGLWLGDGLHPREGGYQIIAATIWAALRLLV